PRQMVHKERSTRLRGVGSPWLPFAVSAYSRVCEEQLSFLCLLSWWNRASPLSVILSHGFDPSVILPCSVPAFRKAYNSYAEWQIIQSASQFWDQFPRSKIAHPLQMTLCFF